jgi:hypothetical protein
MARASKRTSAYSTAPAPDSSAANLERRLFMVELQIGIFLGNAGKIQTQINSVAADRKEKPAHG